MRKPLLRRSVFGLVGRSALLMVDVSGVKEMWCATSSGGPLLSIYSFHLGRCLSFKWKLSVSVSLHLFLHVVAKQILKINLLKYYWVLCSNWKFTEGLGIQWFDWWLCYYCLYAGIPAIPAVKQQLGCLCSTVWKQTISHRVTSCCTVYTVYRQEAADASVRAGKACKGPADYQLINV